MRNLRYYNLKNILFFLILSISGLFVQTSWAMLKVHQYELSCFTESINFHHLLVQAIDCEKLHLMIVETLKSYNELGLVMTKEHSLKNDDQKRAVLSDIMVLIQNADIALFGREKKTLSLIARSIFSRQGVYSNSFGLVQLTKVPYRGFVLNILNADSCSVSESVFSGLVNSLYEIYSLPGALSFMSEMLEYRLNNSELPKIIIELTGDGMKKNPQEILKIFSQGLGDYLKEGNVIVKFSGCNKQILDLSYDLDIYFFCDDLLGYIFKDDFGNLQNLDDLRAALEWSDSGNPDPYQISEACNEGLRLQITQSLAQLEGSDVPVDGMFASAERLRFAARRCGVNSYRFADLKSVPSLEELNFVLGHIEFMFIYYDCHRKLRHPDYTDPDVKHCANLLISGNVLEYLIETKAMEPLEHPNFFSTYFKQGNKQIKKPCSIVYIPVGSVFTTACEGAFIFTVFNCIGADLSAKKSTGLKCLGVTIQYVVQGCVYYLTYISIVSVVQSGFLYQKIIVIGGLACKMILSTIAAHDCEYCPNNYFDKQRKYSQEEKDKYLYELKRHGQKLWFYQRFLRAAAHDLPEIKEYMTGVFGTVFCSAVSSMSILADHCTSLKEKTILVCLSSVGSGVGTAVGNKCYQSVTYLLFSAMKNTKALHSRYFIQGQKN